MCVREVGEEGYAHVPELVVLAHERVERGGGVRARGAGQRGAVAQQHAADARLLAAARPAQLTHTYSIIWQVTVHHSIVNKYRSLLH